MFIGWAALGSCWARSHIQGYWGAQVDLGRGNGKDSALFRGFPLLLQANPGVSLPPTPPWRWMGSEEGRRTNMQTGLYWCRIGDHPSGQSSSTVKPL